MSKRPDIRIKVILVGDAGVGKTALAMSYLHRIFSPIYLQTIGVEFYPKLINMDNRLVEFMIWDTAGQERFGFLMPMYYKGAKAALLVYDITRKETFINIETWLEKIRKYSGDIPIILAGNKTDLEDFRLVNEDEGADLAQKNKLLFIETSAKTGKNVGEVFHRLFRSAYDYVLDTLRVLRGE